MTIAKVSGTLRYGSLRTIELTVTDRNSPKRTEPDRNGLVLFRSGLVRFGEVRSYFGPIRCSSVRFGKMTLNAVRYGPIRSATVRFGQVRSDFGPVRYVSVSYGELRSVTVNSMVRSEPQRSAPYPKLSQ
jgi:hypothetical protein